MVYWAENTGGQFGRVSTTGGAAHPVGSGLSFPYGVFAGPDGVFLGESGGSGAIDMAEADGGLLPLVAQTGSETVELVTAAGRLYWTAAIDETVAKSGRVASMPLTGAKTVSVFAGGLDVPLGITADTTDLYWTTTGQNTGSGPFDFNFPHGTVLTCPLTGCPGAGPTVLAQEQPWCRAIANDTTAIYWSNGGNPPGSGGGVMKLAKP
jgi:hypothetical protein